MLEMASIHMAATAMLRAASIPLLLACAAFAVQELRQSRPVSPSFAPLLASTFGVALLVRLALPQWGFFHDFYHGYGMVEAWMASSGPLLFGDGVPVGETYYGPGAAAWWGLVFQVAPKDERVVFAAGAVVSALTVIPVALFARQLIQGSSSGLIAGLLWSFWPVSVRMAPTEDSSNLATFWMWLGLWLMSGLRATPGLGRMCCAALAISFAIQTRDSMQVVLLFVAVLARFHLRGAIGPTLWARALGFAFFFNAAFLVLYFGSILPAIWTTHGDLLAITPWHFSWASPRNPVLDFTLTPLLATVASILAVVHPDQSGRALRRGLGVAGLAANFVACIKTYTHTDVHMFHLHYLPILAVLAEWGLQLHLGSCVRSRPARAATALAIVGSFGLPYPWQVIRQGFVDQKEYAFVRQALQSVPRGCTVIYPLESEARLDILVGEALEVTPHMPWLLEQRGLQVRSFRWFRTAPRHELDGCLRVLRPLVCFYSAGGISGVASVGATWTDGDRCAGRPDMAEYPAMTTPAIGANRNLFIDLDAGRASMSLTSVAQ